jgi:molybdopterin-guanine dinucleotide biosynthesis protein A
MSARPDGVSPPRSAGTSPAGLARAGGHGSRIGRKKALLGLGPPQDPGAGLEGFTLLGQIAARMRHAAGNVTLVAPPGRYAHSGMFAVAYDLPAAAGHLGEPLAAVAQSSRAEPVLYTGSVPEPPRTINQGRVKAAAESALLSKRFKIQEFVSTLEQSGFEARIWPAPDAARFSVNTPEDWPCLETEAS